MTTHGNSGQQNLLKQAAIVIKRLEERLAPLEQGEKQRTEPIALVGIGCRFPGGANTPDAFWQLLEGGRDAVASLESRWTLVGAHPHQEVPRWAGLLTEPIDEFDPAFFGISPREAEKMDPQQRLLLETSWEALEGAGIAPERLWGSDTGVFVGLMYHEYGSMSGSLETLDGYVSTGNAGSVASGRISYLLGLKGPSLTVVAASAEVRPRAAN